MKAISLMINVLSGCQVNKSLFDSMISLVVGVMNHTDEVGLSVRSYRVKFNPVSPSKIEAVIFVGTDLDSMSEDLICADVESAIERFVGKNSLSNQDAISINERSVRLRAA